MTLPPSMMLVFLQLTMMTSWKLTGVKFGGNISSCYLLAIVGSICVWFSFYEQQWCGNAREISASCCCSSKASNLLAWNSPSSRRHDHHLLVVVPNRPWTDWFLIQSELPIGHGARWYSWAVDCKLCQKKKGQSKHTVAKEQSRSCSRLLSLLC